MSNPNSYCQGHEELRDIALETSNNLKHLKDELHVSNANISRFMEELSKCNQRITNLEINGAKLSQMNALDIVELRDEIEKLTKDVAIMNNNNFWTGKIFSYLLGIFSGLVVGVIILWVDSML